MPACSAISWRSTRFGFAPELTRKVERLDSLLAAPGHGARAGGYAVPTGPLACRGEARRRLAGRRLSGGHFAMEDHAIFSATLASSRSAGSGRSSSSWRPGSFSTPSRSPPSSGNSTGGAATWRNGLPCGEREHQEYTIAARSTRGCRQEEHARWRRASMARRR